MDQEEAKSIEGQAEMMTMSVSNHYEAERLRLVIEATGIATWDEDLTTQVSHWSREAFQILGYEPHVQASRAMWIERVHPDDLERVVRAVEEAVKNRSRFQVEHRIIRADNGAVRWLDSFGRFLYDVQNAPIRFVGMSSDITERKRAEEALRKSEARLRQATASGVFLWEIDTRTSTWNVSENFAQVIGFSPQAVSQNMIEAIQQLIHPDDVAPATEAVKQAIESGQEMNLDARILNPETGENVWLSFNANLERDEHGAPLRLVGSTQNITQRKVAEENMRASEERYRAIVMQAAVGVAQTDLVGRFTFVNERYCQMVGYSREELLGGLRMQDITHAEDLALNNEMIAHISRMPEPFEFEKRYIHKDGSLVWANISVSVIRDVHGHPLYGQAVVLDITERKRAEAMRQHLLGRLVTSQEEERRRISRELHDQMGQSLTAFRLNLGLLKDQISGPADALSVVERLERIASQLDADMDFLAWRLRPAALDTLGLAKALETYVKEWAEHFGLRAELHSSSLKREQLTPELETNLYRIAQEALNNVAKHAGATHVEVLLEQHAHQAVLIVEDDGKGFELSHEMGKDKGLGLITMRERAALFGGTVEIESKPDDGTTVYVRIPLPTKGGT